ncbi:cytochrome P450 [Thamnocephalis sphaerospora]|uniref:Cytochrome P450 n=1 Tax=Thamnocephalis sphaerospora TaxID=78915 RepID=A0A4P9XQT7_9FUNG|nr:cytochrome P450 [Thamnocephalis sphaerospora]|eukprot:RKP07871.1 cytochrome P450 [Thamnocephalis sphaerospora]
MFITLFVVEVTEGATHFLYDIAGYAETRTRLYEEQQQVIAKHGDKITVEALKDMAYLEACLRESLRLNSITQAVYRLAMQDVEFSNGMRIPAGRVCFFNMHAMNRNPEFHQDANEYRPDRIADQPNVRASTITPGFVTFGLGRNACPGRFIAVAEIMTLAAWLLRRYDFTTKSGRRPENQMGATYRAIEDPVIFTKRCS